MRGTLRPLQVQRPRAAAPNQRRRATTERVSRGCTVRRDSPGPAHVLRDQAMIRSALRCRIALSAAGDLTDLVACVA